MKAILHVSACCLLGLCLACCAVKRPAPGIIPTAPAKTAAVAPVAATVRANAAAGAVVSSKLEHEVASLADKTATLQGNLLTAVELADKLRRQKSATEAELQEQWLQLTAISVSHSALQTQVLEARATADDQAAMRVRSEAALDELTAAATNKDAENSTLRTQNTDLGAAVSRLNGEIITLEAAKNKAEKKAAVGSYLKGCIWIGGIVLVAAVAGYFYIKLFARPLG